MLTRHAADHAPEGGGDGSETKLRLRAEAAPRRADLIRQALMEHANENGSRAAEEATGT